MRLLITTILPNLLLFQNRTPYLCATMERTKRAIVLLLLVIAGLGCVEKDMLCMLHCSISTTAATCNSGADSHNGIHHHSHITEYDALNSTQKPYFVPGEINIKHYPSEASIPPKAPAIDAWQPPKSSISLRPTA